MIRGTLRLVSGQDYGALSSDSTYFNVVIYKVDPSNVPPKTEYYQVGASLTTYIVPAFYTEYTTDTSYTLTYSLEDINGNDASITLAPRLSNFVASNRSFDVQTDDDQHTGEYVIMITGIMNDPWVTKKQV